MISPEFSTLLTLCLYGAASIAGMSGMMLRSALLRRAGCWLAGFGFLVQTLMLALGFHSSLPDGLSLGAYLQMLAWFVLLCGLISLLRFRQEAMLLLASPLALILFIMSAPYLTAVIRIPRQLSAPFFTLHIGALFLSLGLLTLAFAAGGIFLFLEGRIKSKQAMKGFWQDMPALSLLDRVNALVVMTAFPLYTLGIVAGLFWGKSVYGATFNGDPKEVISLVVWLLLAVLFHNRLARGWRGRKPARLTVLIFVLCLFSFIVVNTFMETHHAFIRG
ncbi:cytochrome c biogenesis protein CcsA [uncultured Desulfovibrio sp.]|uniref:Cytochrome c biogenesis protein n=1 Tax=Candidatus Desulfovibrio intestinavium TaxID=2838534 RepID=A0A9D2HN26_9BACT|nr:cytochrome c biogenesis protein CcsA [uncultured Desulfovibrio sp.]HJA79262.1 cytochrome c biogenesis protein [Candidatus Desulfovibrio intestinavium]